MKRSLTVEPGRYQRLDLFIKVLRVLCSYLTDASMREIYKRLFSSFVCSCKTMRCTAHFMMNEFYLFMITGRYAGTSLWNSAVHQEVASDSFCFLINSSWLLVFILLVFSLFFSGFNLYCWKGIHFS
jgi:hypothetical protein